MASARPVSERFWEKVDKSSECWLWTAAGHPRDDYGLFKLGGKMKRAHRVAWELTRGTIPDGLTIDHLCRNRRCVNPDHLEPVPGPVNTRRGGSSLKTHCPKNHPYDYVRPDGARGCRTCRREAWSRFETRRGAV